MPGVANIQAGNAAVSLTWSDAGLAPGMAKTQQKLNQFAHSVETSSKGWFANLGKNLEAAHHADKEAGFGGFGKSGKQMVEKFANLIGGAGTGLGLVITEVVVGALAQAVEKAAELSKQFRQGKISAGEMAEELIKSVPIIGEAWKIGRGIREIIGGQEAYEEQLTDAIKEANNAFEIQRRTADRVRETVKSVAKEMREMQTKAAKEGADKGTGDFLDAMANFDNEIEAVRTERNAAIAKNRADQDEAQKKLQAANDAGEAFKKLHGMTAEEAAKLPVHEVVKSAMNTGKGPPIQTVKDVDNSELVAEAKEIQRLQDEAIGAVKGGVESQKTITSQYDQFESARRTAHQREMVKLIRDGQTEINDATANAAADRLRMQGKEGDAELLMVQYNTRKKTAELAKGLAEVAAGTNILNPRNAAAAGLAYAKIGSALNEGGQKEAEAKQHSFGEERAKRRDIELGNANLIENPYERERAQIKARYDFEIDVAQQAGREIDSITRRRLQENLSLEVKHARDVKLSNEEIDDQIASSKIENTERGHKREKDLLELQRKRALEREQDPATTTGVGVEKINQLYDQLEVRQKFSVAGAFGGKGLGQMVGGGAIEYHRRTTTAVEKLVRLAERNNGATFG